MNTETVKGNLLTTPLSKIIRTALIATTIVTLIVLAFTWPTKTSAPHDIPISLAGSAERVQQLKDTMEEKSAGTFHFVDANSRDDVERQIKERETYGGIVMSDDGAPEVLTASAASSATNAMLIGMANQLTQQIQTQAREGQTKGLQDGIAKGKDGVAQLQAGVDQANAVVEAGKKNVDAAQEQLNSLRPQLAESQARADIAQQQLEALTPATEGEGDAANLAREQVDTLNQTIADASTQRNDLQRQVDEAQATVDAQGGPEVQAAQAQLEQMNPKLQQAKAGVAQAEAQLKSLQVQGEVYEKTTAKVTDVVTLSEDDSNGAGLAVSSFPLVMAGMIGGIMMLTLVKGFFSRILTSTIYAALSGLTITLILHTWFGFVQGNFGLLWLAFAVSSMATSFFIIGVGSLLGFGPGMALGAIFTMFLGNPLSGATSPWEFLAKPWGAIGQHMVPGASAHLLRSISYFPDAATAPQWITLIAWIVFGLAIGFIGYLVAQKNKHKMDPIVEKLEPVEGPQLSGSVAVTE